MIWRIYFCHFYFGLQIFLIFNYFWAGAQGQHQFWNQTPTTTTVTIGNQYTISGDYDEPTTNATAPDDQYQTADDEDQEINDAIWNLNDYLASMEFAKNPQVQLKNSTIRQLRTIQLYFESGGTNAASGGVCKACKILVGLLVHHIRQLNTSEQIIEEKLRLMCPVITVGISSEVCYGSIERIIPTAYFVLKNRPQLTVEAFCGFTFQQAGCHSDDPYLEWSIDIKGLPERRRRRKPVKKPKKFPNFIGQPGILKNTTDNETTGATNDKPVKILQLADLHIDPSYMVGAPTGCKHRILCCRNTSKQATISIGRGGGKAGFFSDNHLCDPPMRLLELTLKHLVDKHPDIELFYFTGDAVPHNTWATSREENSGVLIEASELFHKYYPDVRAVMMLGNHEPHPVNFFSSPGAPEELDTRFIYNVSYDVWKQWIPDDQVGTYFTEGYYTVQESDTLKIIALNTNVCYGFNFWGMYDVKDPGGQLEWLVQELEKSEAIKQYVHIVGHVPPGHKDCHKVWSRNFYNIVSRYRSTIKAQFYGHTHHDALKLFYSPTEPGVPINSGFISPSLTAYRSHNPAYKLFYADRTTWDIIDYETWVFDLEEANKTPEIEPNWFRLYKATEAYGIPNTRIENLAVLVNKMAKDKSLFETFYQYYEKALPRQRKAASVYKQKEMLCAIVRPYFKEENECNRVQKQVDGEVVHIPFLKKV